MSSGVMFTGWSIEEQRFLASTRLGEVGALGWVDVGQSESGSRPSAGAFAANFLRPAPSGYKVRADATGPRMKGLLTVREIAGDPMKVECTHCGIAMPVHAGSESGIRYFCCNSCRRWVSTAYAEILT